MSGENEDPNEEEENDEETETETYTKEQVTAMVRKRTREIKKSVQKDLLEALGVDSLDELQEKLSSETKSKGSESNGADDEDKGKGSEVDAAKLRKEIERDLRKQYEADKAERDLELKITEVIVDRYGVGMKAARKMRKMLDEVEVDASEDDIADALDDLEEDMPHLFEGLEGKADDDDEGERPRRRPEDRRQQHSNPGRQPRRPRGKGGDPKSAARTLLHERHPHLKNNKS